MGKVMRRHSLQHRCGSSFKINLMRYRYQAVYGNGGIFGITSSDTGIRDAIAGLDVVHPTANCDNDSSGFLAVNKRERCWIASFAKIDIDEVNSGSFDLNDHFAGLRSGNGKVDES